MSVLQVLVVTFPYSSMNWGRVQPLCACVCSITSESLWPHGQAPLSMETPRQEYQSGLPCPFPGDLPDPGTETRVSCTSCIGKWILYQCAPWEALRFLNYKMRGWITKLELKRITVPSRGLRKLKDYLSPCSRKWQPTPVF